ncbi:MAG: hypothetical protein AB8F74_06985, partial [Saprospiraceae bacterium]
YISRPDFLEKNLILNIDKTFKLTIVGDGFYEGYKSIEYGRYTLDTVRMKLWFYTDSLLEKLRGDTDYTIKKDDKQTPLPNNPKTYFIVNYHKDSLLFTKGDFYDVAVLLNKNSSQVELPEVIYKKNKFSKIKIDKDISESYIKKYANYILKEPIETRPLSTDTLQSFVEIEKRTRYEFLIEFDKGLDDNLLPGMKLFKNHNGNIEDCTCTLKYVFNDKSYGAIEDGIHLKKCLTNPGMYSTEKSKLYAHSTHEYDFLIQEAQRARDKYNLPIALTRYKKAFDIFQMEPIDYYNASKVAIKSDSTDLCLFYLNQAVDNNYFDERKLRKEVDFRVISKSEEWDELLQKIERNKLQFLSKLEITNQIPLERFIPYRDGLKWGFMDSETKEILVPAQFHHTSLYQNFLEIRFTEKNLVRINREEIHNENYYKTVQHPQSKDYKKYLRISFSSHINGFKLDENKEVITLSDQYKDSPIRKITPKGRFTPIPIYYRGPFKLDGKQYIYVFNEKGYGLIDEGGNPHEILNFNSSISRVMPRSNPDTIWFHYIPTKFTLENPNYGFINNFGNRKHIGMNLGKVEKELGFAIISKPKKAGFKIINSLYLDILLDVSKGRCTDFILRIKENTSDLTPKRTLDDVLFLVRESRTRQYYIDIKGNKYIPQ